MSRNTSVPFTPPVMSPNLKVLMYEAVIQRLDALIDDSTDFIAAMSTIVGELHNSFDHFHWTGFYRTTRPEHLQVGPYQGGHGCLDIPFSRGVCGAAARLAETQIVDDVSEVVDHIACSVSTQSEIVIPVLTSDGVVVAVLDIDSDLPSAFDQTDKNYLEQICQKLSLHSGRD